MRLWLVLGVIGLGWSVLCYRLWLLAADPGPRVLALARGIGVAPEDVQWLADLATEAGAGLQWAALALGAGGLVLVTLIGVLTLRSPD
jgi:hypothetical protein